jgi:hypothetical protein
LPQSELRTRIVNYTLNPRSNTPESDTLQHASPSVCIVAQQNSFAKFVSLHLYSSNYKLGAGVRVVTFSTFYFLKLFNFEIAKI